MDKTTGTIVKRARPTRAGLAKPSAWRASTLVSDPERRFGAFVMVISRCSYGMGCRCASVAELLLSGLEHGGHRLLAVVDAHQRWLHERADLRPVVRDVLALDVLERSVEDLLDLVAVGLVERLEVQRLA